MKTTIQQLSAAVVASLSDDLLKPQYRKKTAGKHKTYGHCYAASEAAWHMLGGTKSDYTPHVMRVPGGTHWFLKHDGTGKALDITAKQFPVPVRYEKAVRCPFLTREPSKRAATIIARAKKRLLEKRRKTRQPKEG